jgi:hypothetical protein
VANVKAKLSTGVMPCITPSIWAKAVVFKEKIKTKSTSFFIILVLGVYNYRRIFV